MFHEAPGSRCQVAEKGDYGFYVRGEIEGVGAVENACGFGMYLPVEGEETGDCAAEMLGTGGEKNVVCCWEGGG